MNLGEAMRHARENTRVVRARKHILYTFGATRLPYICLTSPSDTGERVRIRRGEVTADRPTIALPGQSSEFLGFDLDEGDEEEAGRVLIARRVQIPPARYVNRSEASALESGPLEAAIERTLRRLDEHHDIRTAVIQAEEDFWNISILLYVGSQIARSAPSNVAEHIERLGFQHDD